MHIIIFTIRNSFINSGPPISGEKSYFSPFFVKTVKEIIY